MAFLDDHALGTNANFIKIVKMAILKTSSSIIGENPTTTPEIVTTKRHSLGMAVINSTEAQAKAWALHIAAQGTISVTIDNQTAELTYTGGGTSLDSDIEFTVSSLWNDRAGVTYSELNP